MAELVKLLFSKIAQRHIYIYIYIYIYDAVRYTSFYEND